MKATMTIRPGLKGGMHFFLKNSDGVPVSYLRVFFVANSDVPELSDIETRHGHRNVGYASELLKRVSKMYGVERLTYNGEYTSFGYRAISHQVFRNDEAGAARVNSGPVHFVKNWHSMEPVHWD